MLEFMCIFTQDLMMCFGRGMRVFVLPPPPSVRGRLTSAQGISYPRTSTHIGGEIHWSEIPRAEVSYPGCEGGGAKFAIWGEIPRVVTKGGVKIGVKISGPKFTFRGVGWNFGPCKGGVKHQGGLR